MSEYPRPGDPCKIQGGSVRSRTELGVVVIFLNLALGLVTAGVLMMLDTIARDLVLGAHLRSRGDPVGSTYNRRSGRMGYPMLNERWEEPCAELKRTRRLSLSVL